MMSKPIRHALLAGLLFLSLGPAGRSLANRRQLGAAPGQESKQMAEQMAEQKAKQQAEQGADQEEVDERDLVP